MVTPLKMVMTGGWLIVLPTVFASVLNAKDVSWIWPHNSYARSLFIRWLPSNFASNTSLGRNSAHHTKCCVKQLLISWISSIYVKSYQYTKSSRCIYFIWTIEMSSIVNQLLILEDENQQDMSSTGPRILTSTFLGSLYRLVWQSLVPPRLSFNSWDNPKHGNRRNLGNRGLSTQSPTIIIYNIYNCMG